MDAVSFKLTQLILAEVLGIGLCIVGVYFFIRGVRTNKRQSSIVFEGIGVKAKLINASPGIIVLIVGLIVVFISLNSSITRFETNKVSKNRTEILNEWLNRIDLVTGQETYLERLNIISGGIKTRVRTRKIETEMSLGTLSKKEYGSSQYWRLIAVANMERGYFNLSDAEVTTMLPKRAVVDIWDVSKFADKDQATIIRIKDANRAKAYEYLLSLWKSGSLFEEDLTFDELTAYFKELEIFIAIRPADTIGGVQTIGDLSLKYYQDRRFWPLFVWVNPKVFSGEVNENTRVPSDREIYYIFIL